MDKTTLSVMLARAGQGWTLIMVFSVVTICAFVGMIGNKEPTNIRSRKDWVLTCALIGLIRIVITLISGYMAFQVLCWLAGLF